MTVRAIACGVVAALLLGMGARVGLASNELPRKGAGLRQEPVPANLGTIALAGESAPGNAVRGKTLYESRCTACHSVDAHRVGPAHQGVLGRKAGSAKGYQYSEALKNSKVVWKTDTLRAWLADPEALIPGQGMGYRVDGATDRADLVAYLATLK